MQRWQDHLPLHRLESIYRREGIELARSPICGWHMSIGNLCQSLYDAMLADAMSAPFLCDGNVPLLNGEPDARKRASPVRRGEAGK